MTRGQTMTDVATMTDSDIRMDVEAELEWEPSVDEGEIGVAVRDGIVTLTGRVPSFWQKWKAERVARRSRSRWRTAGSR